MEEAQRKGTRMAFFVESLGPLPGQQSDKTNKSAAGADLLKHPSKAGQPASKQQPQRAQPERAAPQSKVVDRAPPPKEEAKKKKGWFN